ncbi:MAG: c-type cytochrome [Gemmatimonadaceae bacterium]|nr:c-type cytochrome [Gemmatimonadaceae bacterium]
MAPLRRLVLPVVAALLGAAGLSGLRSAREAEAAGRVRPATRRDSTRTTMDGVYTLAQATKGKDLFAMRCQSCHTPTQHSGPPFRNKWFGKSLGDLYTYIRREMPKNEPRSLSDQEYTLALAFLLRMNGMPTGPVPLAADSAALQSIRLDSVPAVP